MTRQKELEFRKRVDQLTALLDEAQATALFVNAISSSTQQ
jgi:hypothetical protein